MSIFSNPLLEDGETIGTWPHGFTGLAPCSRSHCDEEIAGEYYQYCRADDPRSEFSRRREPGEPRVYGFLPNEAEGSPC